MAYFRSYWSHMGHIDDHMPAPDGNCGIRTHATWRILRHGPYSLRHRCRRDILLNGQKLTFADKYTYLGIIVIGSFMDDDDLARQM